MLSRLLLNEIIISADVISLFLNKEYFISLVLRDLIFNLIIPSLPESKVLFCGNCQKSVTARVTRVTGMLRARARLKLVIGR